MKDEIKVEQQIHEMRIQEVANQWTHLSGDNFWEENFPISK